MEMNAVASADPAPPCRRLHLRRVEMAAALYPKPPPRPLTVYTCFIRYYLRQYNRTMRRQNDTRAVMQVLREQYRHMDQDDREFFEEEARLERENYTKNLRLWKQWFYDKGRKEIPRIRRVPKPDPTLPRRPMNEYIRFFTDNIAEYIDYNRHMSYKELVKGMGTVWQNMSDEEKQPHRDRARADLQDHEARLAQIAMQRRLAKKLKTVEMRKNRLAKLQKFYGKRSGKVDVEECVDEVLDKEQVDKIMEQEHWNHICF